VIKSIIDNGKYIMQFNESTGELRLIRNGELWDEFPKYSKMLVSVIYKIQKLEAENKKLKELLIESTKLLRNRDFDFTKSWQDSAINLAMRLEIDGIIKIHDASTAKGD